MDSTAWQSLLSEVLQLLWEHAILVGISSFFAIVVGVGAGIAATRNAAIRKASLTIANVFQTIPSLALFGFLLPLPFIGGIGKRTAILSLILYSVLPVLRNTVAGIAGVDATLRDAAVAMGMTDRQLLRLVELPLAFPTIMAGIRVAVVTNIGTAVIAAVIGGGGLGVLIFRGVSSVNTIEILAGAVPAAAMALGADALLGMVEKRRRLA